MLNTLGKLLLILLNATLILACVAVMAFVTWAIWGEPCFALYSKVAGLGFVWGMTGLAVWVFGMDIKAIWRE